jgi:uncharacterized membrane protein
MRGITGNRQMKRYYSVLWLWLSIVCLVTIMLPLPLMAQEVKVDLALTLIPDNYYTRVKAGQDNKSFLEIRNTGNKAVTNIRLSADIPEGWAIQFKPDKIDYLGYGGVQTVDVNIRPPGKTAEGEYRLNLIAEGSEIRKVSSILVTVRTPTAFWLWVGAIAGVIVIAAFIFIFLRFGRQ